MIKPIMKNIEAYGIRLRNGCAPDQICGRYFNAESAMSLRDGSASAYPRTNNTAKSMITAKMSLNATLMIIPTINPMMKGIIMGNIHANSVGITLLIYQI
jgi:hypothetical protein